MSHFIPSPRLTSALQPPLLTALLPALLLGVQPVVHREVCRDQVHEEPLRQFGDGGR